MSGIKVQKHNISALIYVRRSNNVAYLYYEIKRCTQNATEIKINKRSRKLIGRREVTVHYWKIA